MSDTVSVRIGKPELKKVEELSRMEQKTKSHILREVLEKGIKEKRLEIALAQYRDHTATAWKAAQLADMPLSVFLDVATKNGIDFHYGMKELKEDFEGFF
tara:strand:+ start:123 stop:422 length:300 start_codon:yes stop_codon:yes gene_type:complete